MAGKAGTWTYPWDTNLTPKPKYTPKFKLPGGRVVEKGKSTGRFKNLTEPFEKKTRHKKTKTKGSGLRSTTKFASPRGGGGGIPTGGRGSTYPFKK